MSKSQTLKLTVEDVRRALSESETHLARAKIDRAEKTLDDVKELLSGMLFLHNGRLSTGTIDYAAFRVQTLSLIFEVALRTFRVHSNSPEQAYDEFLADLGDEVGFTFARDLLTRLIHHDFLLHFQQMRRLLDLWASFENDTGAGETKIKTCESGKIVIQLRNNPLRRAESTPHAHCGFYANYLTSLINEIYTKRARYIRSVVEGSDVQAQSVATIEEHPDAEGHCVFVVECRPEKLTRSFDLLTEGYDSFYDLDPGSDFSACVNKARSALVSAQMETVGFSPGRPSRELYKIYRELLDRRAFRRMDEVYQRASKPLHLEADTGAKLDQTSAWSLLRDVRRSVYALEALDLTEEHQNELKKKVALHARLVTLEELANQTKDLDKAEKHQLSVLIQKLKKGMSLDEDNQASFASTVLKAGDKAWEVARPILIEVLTAALKKRYNLN